MNKNELRCHFKEQRQLFVSKQSKSLLYQISDAMTSRLKPLIDDVKILASYAAMTSEPDPGLLLREWATLPDREIALPWFENRQAPMLFRAATPILVDGPFGIEQPYDDSPLLDPDVVLVPLVAVDTAGNRLGHGKGHYDRALEAMRRDRPIKAIGLAWECQIADAVPVDAWDQPLDHIVTSERLIEPPK